jgi:hypothetical protein
VYGSQHPLLARVMTTWNSAIQRLTDANQALEGTETALADYARTIGVDLGASRGTNPAVLPDGAEREQPSPHSVSLANVVPAEVQLLADRLTPWKPGEDTVGYAYDDDRQHLDDERFASRRIGSASRGLAGRYRLVRTFTDHIEGHVAARMREPGGPDHVVLAGCDRLLRDILPVGKTITVYVKDENGVRLYGVFEGNGKGVAS